MNEEQKKKLEAASRIGKGMWFKNKTTGKRSCLGTIEDEVYIFVGDYKHLIQRIHFNPGVSWDGSEFGYRSGYYTFDKTGKRVKWGQYTQFLTEKEYPKLLVKAKEKGWLI